MTMTTVPLTTLLAGLILPAAQWTEVIVPIVVFVIWIINQIANLNKGKPQGPKPQANRPPLPNPRQNRGPLEEVEQFLRDTRKAMEGQQRGAGQQVAPPPQRQQLQKPKPQQQKQQKQTKKPEKPAPRKSLAEQSRLRPQADEGEWDRATLGGSVAEHVSQHLGGNKFDERTGRLSQIQKSVEQDIGTHVKGAFDHQVGSLAVQRDAVADSSAAADVLSDVENPAAQIIAMLRDPQSLRNAIVLQEILQPPTHRW